MSTAAPGVEPFARQLRAWWLGGDTWRRRGLPWREEGVTTLELAATEALMAQTPADVVAFHWWAIFDGLRLLEPGAMVGPADVEDLARRVAPLGLGDRKARTMVSIAEVVTTGRWTEPGWGLGPYTLGMVRLATGQGVAAPVDTNVSRVARRAGWSDPEDFSRSLSGWATAHGWGPDHLPPGYAALSAVMDLGHVYCRAAVGSCLVCPCQSECPKW